MRILVLSNEVWNDKINGNNVTSNWFEGMDAEFANIYCEPGSPYNKCCKRYFQITDMMMLKSIFCKKKAGRKVLYAEQHNSFVGESAEQESKKLREFLKKITGNYLRLAREILWLIGRYDTSAMKQFIDEFRPDVVFSERMASCKMLRLEGVVHSITNVPFFAFTGDDEYSLKQLSFSPFFWINRFMIRRRLRNNVNYYCIYYTLSLEQSQYYEKIFGCNCMVLQKCGIIEDKFAEKNIGNPIKIIYAGKFYCNRWKVLAEIAKAISIVNNYSKKFVLQIYTKDIPNKKQNQLLNDGYNSQIIGPVSQAELKGKYKEADIALHVESRDIKNRLATRFSYSTKIIDCLFSGCAVMTYCWDKHSGFTSLKREDASMCISTFNELLVTLKDISSNPEMLKNYQKKAYKSCIDYHNKEKTQAILMENFAKGSIL